MIPPRASARVALPALLLLIGATFATSTAEAARHHRESPAAQTLARASFTRLLSQPGAGLPAEIRRHGSPTHTLSRRDFQRELTSVRSELRQEVATREALHHSQMRAIWTMYHAGRIDAASFHAEWNAAQVTAIADILNIRAEIRHAHEIVLELASKPPVSQVALIAPPGVTHALPGGEGVAAGSPSR